MRGKKQGFTIIEILIVIAVVGSLATMIMINMSKAKAKSRDAKRYSDLSELVTATELYYDDMKKYPATVGNYDNLITNTSHAYIVGDDLNDPNNKGMRDYLASFPQDPKGTGNFRYGYFRKDYPGNGCNATDIIALQRPKHYSYFVQLENPTSADTSTISDVFDTCISHPTYDGEGNLVSGISYYNMNYRKGN